MVVALTLALWGVPAAALAGVGGQGDPAGTGFGESDGFSIPGIENPSEGSWLLA